MPRFRKLSSVEIPAHPPTRSVRAQVAQAYVAQLHPHLRSSTNASLVIVPVALFDCACHPWHQHPQPETPASVAHPALVGTWALCSKCSTG